MKAVKNLIGITSKKKEKPAAPAQEGPDRKRTDARRRGRRANTVLTEGTKLG